MHGIRATVAGLVKRVLATLARHSAVVPVNDFLNRALAEAFAHGFE